MSRFEEYLEAVRSVVEGDHLEEISEGTVKEITVANKTSASAKARKAVDEILNAQEKTKSKNQSYDIILGDYQNEYNAEQKNVRSSITQKEIKMASNFFEYLSNDLGDAGIAATTNIPDSPSQKGSLRIKRRTIRTGFYPQLILKVDIVN